jgi:hypothetical protein
MEQFTEDEEDDELPRGRRLHEDDEYGEEDVSRSRGAGWQGVRRGVRLLLLGMSLLGLAFIVGFVGNMMVGAAGPGFAPPPPGGRFPPPSPAASGMALVVAGLQMLLQLGWFGTKVAAYIFFLGVPARTGAKGLAITQLSLLGVQILAAFALFGIAVTLGMGTALFSSPQLLLGAGLSLLIVAILSMLATVSETIVSLLFFKSVSEGLKARGLAKSWNYLLMLYAAVITTFLFFAVVMVAMIGGIASTAGSGPPSPGAAGLVGGVGLVALCGGCVGGLMGLTWVIWYIVTLTRLNGVLQSRATRG